LGTVVAEDLLDEFEVGTCGEKRGRGAVAQKPRKIRSSPVAGDAVVAGQGAGSREWGIEGEQAECGGGLGPHRCRRGVDDELPFDGEPVEAFADVALPQSCGLSVM